MGYDDKKLILKMIQDNNVNFKVCLDYNLNEEERKEILSILEKSTCIQGLTLYFPWVDFRNEKVDFKNEKSTLERIYYVIEN